jgi:hypothetical protein
MSLALAVSIRLKIVALVCSPRDVSANNQLRRATAKGRMAFSAKVLQMFNVNLAFQLSHNGLLIEPADSKEAISLSARSINRVYSCFTA